MMPEECVGVKSDRFINYAVYDKAFAFTTLHSGLSEWPVQ